MNKNGMWKNFMAKRKSWFGWVKSLFISESKDKVRDTNMSKNSYILLWSSYNSTINNQSYYGYNYCVISSRSKRNVDGDLQGLNKSYYTPKLQLQTRLWLKQVKNRESMHWLWLLQQHLQQKLLLLLHMLLLRLSSSQVARLVLIRIYPKETEVWLPSRFKVSTVRILWASYNLFLLL